MSAIDHLISSVNIPPYFPKVSYHDGIFMVGSCFAQHMEKKLNRYKYRVLSNPFGILYNPTSISTSFQRIAGKQYYSHDELVMHDGLYHSMDHHGSFSDVDPEKILTDINQSMDTAHAHLQASQFVFISLGTSKVYKYKETGCIAGNNHKIPAIRFEPHSLTVEECENEIRNIHQAVRSLSPDAHVIWTVSPVRHLRDGLVENQRSKATLIVAIANYMNGQERTNYFPAYEIMIDQLRDYRFYARDLIHPSELAIDIIWELLAESYFDPQDLTHHAAIEKIAKAREHRFLHNNRNAIKSFAEAQLRNIDHLAALYPDMEWKEERQYFFHFIEPD